MRFRTLFAGLLLGTAAMASTWAYAASLSSTEISSQSVLLSTGEVVADPVIDMATPIKDAKVEQTRAYDAASFSSVTDGISLKVAQGESNADRSHAVPLPSAIWLFGSALVGFITMSNRRRV
ncbi:MAG TPA: hypothetical protein VF811_15465 [Parasulfuritortus sp.]